MPDVLPRPRGPLSRLRRRHRRRRDAALALVTTAMLARKAMQRART